MWVLRRIVQDSQTHFTGNVLFSLRRYNNIPMNKDYDDVNNIYYYYFTIGTRLENLRVDELANTSSTTVAFTFIDPEKMKSKVDVV